MIKKDHILIFIIIILLIILCGLICNKYDFFDNIGSSLQQLTLPQFGSCKNIIVITNEEAANLLVPRYCNDPVSSTLVPTREPTRIEQFKVKRLPVKTS